MFSHHSFCAIPTNFSSQTSSRNEEVLKPQTLALQWRPGTLTVLEMKKNQVSVLADLIPRAIAINAKVRCLYKYINGHKKTLFCTNLHKDVF